MFYNTLSRNFLFSKKKYMAQNALEKFTEFPKADRGTNMMEEVHKNEREQDSSQKMIVGSATMIARKPRPDFNDHAKTLSAFIAGHMSLFK